MGGRDSERERERERESGWEINTFNTYSSQKQPASFDVIVQSNATSGKWFKEKFHSEYY